jgi:hypothetical protein
MSHNQDLPRKPLALPSLHALLKLGSALTIAEARRHSKLGAALRRVVA